MDEEMENHKVNGSFEWIRKSSIPAGRHLIKLVWVFKVKRDGRLKSRLCVQGCAQTKGVDFDQTYSGALRSTSLRALASLAARRDLKLHRWDFVSAYLQGELEIGEAVYCHAPPGYPRRDEAGHELVCKVVKPVYGMAQAGRRWQRSFFPWLKEYGFVASESDSCLFTCTRTTIDSNGAPREETLVVGVYVDDLACAYGFDDATSLYTHFTTALQERWKVEDEGELSDLLGIDFSISGGVVSLSQSKYIEKIAKTYLSENRSGSDRMPHKPSIDMDVADAVAQDAADIDPVLLNKYQSLVGALIYCATNTRPDVAYAVGMLSRAMGKPTDELLLAAERVLWYLVRTKHLGLRYEASPKALHGYSDSDWAVKHSTSGWVFMMNRAAISWGSKKQKCVALSSCEAEIMAASQAAQESVHLSRLESELGLASSTSTTPTELFVDNKSAIDVAYNPEHHGRMKHVERKHFYVRELVEQHKLRVTFVSTDDNLSDFFTKPLKAHRFMSLRDKIMNVDPALRDGVESTGGRCNSADHDSMSNVMVRTVGT